MLRTLHLSRANFTWGKRGRCSGDFGIGGAGRDPSPRCSSSKSPSRVAEAAIDFTHGGDLGVTIAGEPFPHLLFEVGHHSHWTWVAVAFGETFEALVAGVQGALWALGGVPEVLRSDNLSAATHELKASSGRDLTVRFRAVLDHYRLRSSRITPGPGRMKTASPSKKAHRRLKSLIWRRPCSSAVMPPLTIRRVYEAFVQEVVVYWRNWRRRSAWRRSERRSTPYRPPRFRATRRITPSCGGGAPFGWRIAGTPCRPQLMGHTVEARAFHADVVEVRYRDQVVQTMPRLRKEDEHRIDYRHVIGWLVRKPGAFARATYRAIAKTSISRHLPTRLRCVGADAWRARRCPTPSGCCSSPAATVGEARVRDALEAVLDQGRRLRLRHDPSPGWPRLC